MSEPTTIVIPTLNGEAHILDCLSSLFKQSLDRMHVLAVDNGSSDNTRELIKSEFPVVTLIENEENLGFSTACNQGIQASSRGPVVLLNQDTVVDEDWLACLIGAMENDPGIGVAGSLTRYPDGSIQHSGGYLDDRGNGHHTKKRPESADPLDVEFATGAALAISREALETLGSLDESFFPAYFEDVDYCYRARHAGFRVVVVPPATAIHKEESQLADDSFRSNFYFQKNRLRFVIKHWPLDRFAHSFLPNETSWLASIGEGGEVLVSSVHHAYFETLSDIADIIGARSCFHHKETNVREPIVDGLLKLRGIVPLGPARVFATS